MAEHYWASKVFRREGVLRGARRRSLPPSLALPRLAASLFLLALLALAWRNHVLQIRLEEPRHDIHVQDLFADTGPRRGEQPPPPAAPPPSAGYLLLVLHAPDAVEVYPRYDVELRQARAGRTLWVGRDVAPSDFGTFTVGMPRGFLGGGPCAVRLYGVERSGRRALLASYPLQASTGEGGGAMAREATP